MKTLVEYQLEDGTSVLIEGEPEEGLVRASRDRSGNIVTRANQNFTAAMSSIKSSVKTIRSEIEILEADEVELTLGLTTAGETGVFVIGKGTAEANFTITLKWKKGENKK